MFLGVLAIVVLVVSIFQYIFLFLEWLILKIRLLVMLLCNKELRDSFHTINKEDIYE